MKQSWKINGWIILCLLFCGIFLAPSAQSAPRKKLHLVYVTNRDRDPLPDYKGRLHRIMTDIQDFFRTEMKRNGYDAKTFALDLDAHRKAVVHLVTLDWDFDPQRKFTITDLKPAIAQVLKKKGIDIDQEYIVVFENVYWNNGGRMEYDMVYTGVGNPIKGATWVADHEWLDPRNIDASRTKRINDRGQKLTMARFCIKMIGGVAHEFGHGLGFPHNHETQAEFEQLGKALMGAGNYTYRQERLGKNPHGTFLTPAHAFILSLHPLFNGKIPASFAIPPTLIKDLTFKEKNEKLVVSGRIEPYNAVAGVVFYYDPLPTGINKDYDAFSYLTKVNTAGHFSIAMPMLKGKDAALTLKVYFKNGLFRSFTYLQKGSDGLRTLRKDYFCQYAFDTRNVALLKKLIVQLEKEDPQAAKRAKLFLWIAKQWESFPIPSQVDKHTKQISLSSSRWDTASVGWFIPSFNGILEPTGKWFQPLGTVQGKCKHGLFAHAPSRYTYSLGGKWSKLKTQIGIQRGKRNGSVIFVIKGDGKELYRSALIRMQDGPVPVEVNISDIKSLELITEPSPDGSNDDWGLWIAPSLLR